MTGTGGKIGYSASGGIYIGRNIRTGFHKHHLNAVVISFSKPFCVQQEHESEQVCEAAFIPSDLVYRLSTDVDDGTAFIHIDPYSDAGLGLRPDAGRIITMSRSAFTSVFVALRDWYLKPEPDEDKVAVLVAMVADVIHISFFPERRIDERILRCIRRMRLTDDGIPSLQIMAKSVFLSAGRFSHLFKEETGISFRAYVQHCKLIRSLKAIHEHSNLTAASYEGGFSDQPHFTKTFLKTFGIIPSKVKNS